MLLATFTSTTLVSAFTIPHRSISRYSQTRTTHFDGKRTTGVYTKIDDDDDNDEEEKDFNPYADPNYPELEFVNYDDPEYRVDQGDEFFSASDDTDTTEAEIEAMRESRRCKNDEFQFETFFADCLNSGDEFKGEWTVYRTSTFLETTEEKDNMDGAPAFRKSRKMRKVVSNGGRISVDPPANEEFAMKVDGERIVHSERLAEAKDFEEDEEWEEAIEASSDPDAGIVGLPYWPESLSPRDFRGEAGIMCVGSCYTICDGKLLNGAAYENEHDGPFAELRTEVGILYKRMRFRVKWDYRLKDDDVNEKEPDLHLYSMVVCRETRGRWPRYNTKQNVDLSDNEKLFGAPGAPGGLYDPPLVGSDEQAAQYCSLDLDGGATVLFPYKINQQDGAHDGNGWVQSLDWTPGRIRYQADRKFLGGKKLKGLKTLELSEVEGASADQWRPNDDGENMRQ